MYAQKSDKWHFTMKRYMGLDPDTSFLFGILPGVCREAIGRYDWMYTDYSCFNSNKVYAWSEHHANKINDDRFSRNSAFYGTAPFLWEVARIAAREELVPESYWKPEGTLFFLPRDDQVTTREDEWESVQKLIDEVPRPVTFLLPWRKCDIWKSYHKLRLGDNCKFIQMNDPITRQYTLSKAFLEHEYVYMPWPGTDLYYADFLDKKIVVYDKLEMYRTKHKGEMDREMELVLNYLKWGWDYLTDKQKKYFNWTIDWNSIDEDVRKYLTTKMLGLNALQSPAELYDSLMTRGWLTSQDNFKLDPEYQLAYEWLKSKIQEKTPRHSHHDHPHIKLL
tara:strand:- start:951 stop:1955 length:1005 start_codon:yes stop_codon:yes gene_type:complete